MVSAAQQPMMMANSSNMAHDTSSSKKFKYSSSIYSQVRPQGINIASIYDLSTVSPSKIGRAVSHANAQPGSYLNYIGQEEYDIPAS